MTAGLARGPRERPLLQVEKLGKLYPLPRGLFERQRFVHAVDGVSFYVRRGETFGLVGESGSGKTTLGRTVLRLVEPTLGRITFDGHDVTRMADADLRALRRHAQMTFQDPHASLNPRMTALEIVSEGLTIFRLVEGQRAREDRVAELLTKVGLAPEMMSRFPHEFSGGQRQRIGIARALAVSPAFIVCDEPVSALDVSVQAQIVNLLEALQAELDMSYLFISHDLRVVTYTAHRMAVMVEGRIVEMGPTPEVAEKQHHPYTRALFAASPSFERRARKLAMLPPPRITERNETGCVFFGRCPKGEAGRCDADTPQLDELVAGSHHRVACFFPETDAPA